jgi:hypothetical protein
MSASLSSAELSHRRTSYSPVDSAKKFGVPKGSYGKRQMTFVAKVAASARKF